MDSAIWIALLATAAGTLFMRALPLLWMQRHLDRQNDKSTVEAMPVWLSVLGPTMIAAMFGVSLVPTTATPASWLATACGVLVTLFVWYRTRSLGWPVFAGVGTYGAVIFLANIAS
ncbi:AzlD domain-containing protein [Microbulbifer taiwanensis]|uniref:AzlD domain-containing protein n=1 Tax=Microbulbifer taiwanensis TaxID=986746 RepID=A0ABW1YJ32_9GAMM|nr:AzlD domain-containing protein [Microbulbifer taiwanensis]